MMHEVGGMMWGMSLVWLIVVVLVLAAAALVKYLFFGDRSRPSGSAEA